MNHADSFSQLSLIIFTKGANIFGHGCMLFTSVQFTNVHILDYMYTYVSYDGQCIVMRGLIAQAEDSL